MIRNSFLPIAAALLWALASAPTSAQEVHQVANATKFSEPHTSPHDVDNDGDLDIEPPSTSTTRRRPRRSALHGQLNALASATSTAKASRTSCGMKTRTPPAPIGGAKENHHLRLTRVMAMGYSIQGPLLTGDGDGDGYPDVIGSEQFCGLHPRAYLFNLSTILEGLLWTLHIKDDDYGNMAFLIVVCIMPLDQRRHCRSVIMATLQR